MNSDRTLAHLRRAKVWAEVQAFPDYNLTRLQSETTTWEFPTNELNDLLAQEKVNRKVSERLLENPNELRPKPRRITQYYWSVVED